MNKKESIAKPFIITLRQGTISLLHWITE